MDEPDGGSDAASAGWHRVDDVLAGDRLAFDHAEILHDALGRAGLVRNSGPAGSGA